jgi:hypothetical protein
MEAILSGEYKNADWSRLFGGGYRGWWGFSTTHAGNCQGTVSDSYRCVAEKHHKPPPTPTILTEPKGDPKYDDAYQVQSV